MTATEAAHGDLTRRALALVQRRAFREAHALCLQVLDLDAADAEANFVLGLIGAEHDNFTRASELFEKALACAPNEPRYLAHWAKTLTRLKRVDEARAAAERAISIGPPDAITFDTLGVVLSHAGQHAAAAPLFEKAAELEPNNPSFLHNLGASRQFCGDLVGAISAFRRELELQPFSRRAYAPLVHLSKQTRDNNFIAELERQFAEAKGDPNPSLQIAHALSKTYEDLGEPLKAFDWLVRGKAAKLADLHVDPRANNAVFAAVRRLFDESGSATGDRNVGPIFIVGMPRTGTTLLDRVISNHADVATAGELSVFAQALARQKQPIDFERLGADYITGARAVVGDGKPMFTDKMPVNFLYAGLIHRALPNARIICLRRHPMDACLSNFRQIFSADAQHYWYTYSMEQTARQYVLFDELIAYWRRALPRERFTEVWYEDLVGDLETHAQRLIAFCGLKWDARCLAFHENEQPVATASSVQVRSPLYASSVGRWRAYGDALSPFREVLTAAGIKID